jgi:hypothetical protein
MRTYRRTVWSLQRWLLHDRRHETDVFIHTWDALGWFSKVDGCLMTRDFSSELKVIRRVYRPVVLSVESPLTFDTADFPICRSYVKDGTRGEHIFSMFYKIKLCDDARQAYEQSEGSQYDLVIRSRPDIMHAGAFPFTGLPTPDTVYTHRLGHVGGMNDMIAAGDGESMAGYSRCFDHLRQYVNDGCLWRPEALLYYHVQQLGLTISPIDIHYHLERGNGRPTQIRSAALGTHYRRPL